MLVFDLRLIGNKLYEIRKKKNMTRVEVAESAGLSDRTYADIERGSVNMRIETFLKICDALDITPNDVLTEKFYSPEVNEDSVFSRLEKCSPDEKRIALNILSAYLNSID